VFAVMRAVPEPVVQYQWLADRVAITADQE